MLAVCKAAGMAGCEWCMDFGSVRARDAGITEQQLRELPRYRESEAFTDEEKLVIEYAEGTTRTPVNWALGIGSEDYSQGMFCMVPEPASTPSAAAT